MNTRTLSGILGIELINDPNLTEMVGACGEWMLAVKSNPPRPHWLSLVGNSGTGKTHCVRAVWNWITRLPVQLDVRNQQVYQPANPPWVEFCPRVIHWPGFLQGHLRNGEFEEYQDMKRWPFLVLDDIGAEKDTTGFSAEQLCTLLDARSRKWTLLTSNLLLGRLAKIDTRIADRMIRDGNVVVELTTISYSIRTGRKYNS